MAGLTTHILDTANGLPAKGVRIELYDDKTGKLLGEFVTNDDGRCDQPLLAPDEMKIAVYRLEFFTADYFAARGHELSDPPFLDQITIRFAIADTKSHYHVPLLVSPFAYSTYRGS
ncbi:MAG: hydroxyisourate hydrolase [Robiginitomaculum sp.]|nr:hydroxyisourate hydrolase [Robiginitomaculum sp.]